MNMIPEINLLPRIGKRETNSKTAFAVIAIITVAAMAALVWQIIITQNKVEQLNSQLVQLQEAKKVLQNTHTTEGNTSDLYTKSLEFVESITYPVSPLMDEVSTLLISSTYLRDYKFGENLIELVIYNGSINDISKNIAQLQESQYFFDVEVTSIKEVSGSGSMRYEAALKLHVARVNLTLDNSKGVGE